MSLNKNDTLYECHFYMEATIRIELMNGSFADSCLTAWLRRHIYNAKIFRNTALLKLKAICQRVNCLQYYYNSLNGKLFTCRHHYMERETRFELATSALARQRSTTEPFPHLCVKNLRYAVFLKLNLLSHLDN